MNLQTPPIRYARTEQEQIEQLSAHLQQQYSVPQEQIQVVRAPLRICPLGAHIDHQLGVVTGMTIDQSLLLVFAPTSDGMVSVESLNFDNPVQFTLDNVPPYQAGDWGNYIRGAVLALQRDYPLNQGIVGVIGGDMPVGGLSSSAAVTIAYLIALGATNDISVGPERNVELVTATEHEYIGLNNGILDQTSILFSEYNHLTRIDCQTRQIDKIPISSQVGDFDILAVYSGVTDMLEGTGYNNRVAECQEAARMLLSFAGNEEISNPRLRDVDPAIFEAEKHRLPEAIRRRATHYFGEMQRVAEGVEAWQAGDLTRFGNVMTESGQSSVEQYECGCPQLITLYEILRETPGVYGNRFSGAGFRGNCLALIDPSARKSIAESIHRVYPTTHPECAERYSIHFCQPAGPATLL